MPDTPGLSTLDMQEKFDEPAKELCAPKINALIDALTAATGAADIGATAPQGLSGANIQALINALKSYVDAHKSDTGNPHSVTAAQTGAYTKEETDAQIDQKVVSIGTGDMAQAVYDPDHLGEDATIQLYTHSKTGTIHNFVGSGANGRALITAEFEAGDSVALNGRTVTATCGPDPVDGDTIVNGKWVSFVADEAGSQINFKGGGGVGLSRLALANATADQVSNGRTFYAGDKNLKTGTLVERGTAQNGTNCGVNGSGDSAYLSIRQIPEGIYRANGTSWGPEARLDWDSACAALFKGVSISQWTGKLTDTSGTLTHTFPMRKGQVILFVVHGACRDNNQPTLSLSTPNCTNLLNYDSGIYTQDAAYMANRILVRVVRVNADATASATVKDPGDNVRSVGFMGAWRVSPI